GGGGAGAAALVGGGYAASLVLITPRLRRIRWSPWCRSISARSCRLISATKDRMVFTSNGPADLGSSSATEVSSLLGPASARPKELPLHGHCRQFLRDPRQNL